MYLFVTTHTNQSLNYKQKILLQKMTHSQVYLTNYAIKIRNLKLETKLKKIVKPNHRVIEY